MEAGPIGSMGVLDTYSAFGKGSSRMHSTELPITRPCPVDLDTIGFDRVEVDRTTARIASAAKTGTVHSLHECRGVNGPRSVPDIGVNANPRWQPHGVPFVSAHRMVNA